jgi:hypothetical protein
MEKSLSEIKNETSYCQSYAFSRNFKGNVDGVNNIIRPLVSTDKNETELPKEPIGNDNVSTEMNQLLQKDFETFAIWLMIGHMGVIGFQLVAIIQLSTITFVRF